MIVGQKELLSYLKLWLTGLKNQSNRDGFVLPITGGVDSFVTTALCLSINPLFKYTIIFTGFKEETVFYSWIKDKYSYYKNINYLFTQHPKPNLGITTENFNRNIIGCYMGSFVSEQKLLAVGSLNKDEYSLIRSFDFDTYDAYPLIDLYRSEVIELGKFLEIPKELLDRKSKTEDELGITFTELEWLDRENNSTNILSSSISPTSSKFWGFYDQRKKFVISKIYNMYKEVKHKEVSQNKMCLARKYLPGLLS